MSYDLYEQGPSVYIPVLVVSLLITLVAYGAFPIIFAKIRKKQITKGKYKTLCYIFNFFVMFLFIAMNGKASGGPYILWTWVFTNSGVKILNRNMKLIGSEEVDSIKTEKSNLKEQGISEKLYFENPSEFIMYVNIHKDSKVIWESSDKYVELFKKGYQCFEQRQFEKAINYYKDCLKLNPIGINARFELAECYIATRQLSLAKKSLYEMIDFLYEDAMKAKFYRRIGYIAIEENSYKEAYACYIYSLEYEKNPSVIQEIAYILSKAGHSIENIDIEETLSENNIPLLKSRECVETSEEPEITLTQSQEKTYRNNFCRICGTKLANDSKFCHKCGTEIVEWSE